MNGNKEEGSHKQSLVQTMNPQALHLTPTDWWYWNYEVTMEGKDKDHFSVQLELPFFYDGTHFMYQSEEYLVSRITSIVKGDQEVYLLKNQQENRVIATATKKFGCCHFIINHLNKEYIFRTPGFFTLDFVLEEATNGVVGVGVERQVQRGADVGGTDVINENKFLLGSIKSDAWFTTRSTIDLPERLSVPVRIFLGWLYLIIRQRYSRSRELWMAYFWSNLIKSPVDDYRNNNNNTHNPGVDSSNLKETPVK